ncbi:unnamed protein product [Ranitomeya imitator]|uniref:D-isomer specific 2-hydroxyacid dehydrogenase NAD-binding domain-containing protein n=1 Tax=Ranitomeya imitator TaxID=111125 RepID=A0ABN9LCK7_9NEOB|nr:unnamed protein product [Ranitomeya imitator]
MRRAEIPTLAFDALHNGCSGCISPAHPLPHCEVRGVLNNVITYFVAIMEERPYALMSHSGGSKGFPQKFETIVKEHFHILYLEEFTSNKNAYAPKVKALLMWWHLPVVDKELLDSLPNLKVIASSGAGVDHLDLKLITNYGIIVTNTPHLGDDATADTGMALMLSSAKNIVEGNRISHSPDTTYFDFNREGDDITEATLGIIGMGSIGYSIAQRAKGFRMRILYHNRKRRTVEEEVAVGAEYCSTMTDLLRQSDFVMIVVTLNSDTHNLIGREELKLMKPTAHLINISRVKMVYRVYVNEKKLYFLNLPNGCNETKSEKCKGV